MCCLFYGSLCVSVIFSVRVKLQKLLDSRDEMPTESFLKLFARRKASTPAIQPTGEVVEKGSSGGLVVELPGVESLAELGDKPNISLNDKEKKQHRDHGGSRSHIIIIKRTYIEPIL